MPRNIQLFLLPFLLLSAAFAVAQDRPSCTLMKGLDLKSLLGADHDAPVPFGQNSCRAESNSPGRLIVLAVEEGKAAEIKSSLASMKKLIVQHRAKEATIAAEPTLGPDAFSVRDRASPRGIEVYALKGSRFINIQGSWPTSKPLDDAGAKQLVALLKTVQDKLP
jgi:hypothetical protein